MKNEQERASAMRRRPSTIVGVVLSVAVAAGFAIGGCQSSGGDYSADQVKQMQTDAADAKAGVVSPEVQAQKNAAIAAMRASEPTPGAPPAGAGAPAKPQ